MTIYDKGCISNYRNCSLCCFSNVLYRMLTLNYMAIIILYLSMNFMNPLIIYIDILDNVWG